MKIEMELTKEQYLILISALDTMSRVHQGQFKDVIREASESSKNLLCYEEMSAIEKAIKKYVFPELSENTYYGISSDEVSERSRIMYDILQVMRYEYSNNFKELSLGVWKYPPIKYSKGNDLPKINIIEV